MGANMELVRLSTANILAGERYCPRCGAVKHRRSFGKDIQRPDNVRVYCKSCSAEITRISYAKRKELRR